VDARTNGPVTAAAVLAPILKEEDIAKYRGQLKGKFVLTAAIPENPERFERKRTATRMPSWRSLPPSRCPWRPPKIAPRNFAPSVN